MRGLVAIAVLLTVLTGCGSGGAEKKELTVFAAASLTETFTALGARFEAARPGVKVTFNFGSSATLAQQIGKGAPADVFAAASPATMKQVSDKARVFARNRLEIAVPKGNPARVAGLADLARPEVTVALCAPQVPCGAAAAKVLQGLKVTPVTLEQDVKATLTKVTLGEVDAALVYRTDVRAAAGKVEGVEFAESARAVNDYPIVALTGGLADDFVSLVLSEQGRGVLTAAGFEGAAG
ncbi:molybdate ABC transporter substrate-binding protein [Nonomuraea africana]|uniref:Molybdate transport system substrate-binding protein n=1 Tax=Nonomuraea africana TaxID=46171 RepID=A0ABR9KL13_9ACTN|nr:molybdate ABC transporter substrate-binding protein [Nonomuraea africana]MBE1562700.1 molybdate transport system substrate-binding protein [Nonomuraea africana]